MSTFELIAAVVGAMLTSTVLTAWITSHYNKKAVEATAVKTNADAKTDIAESTLKWAEILTRRIDNLELKLESKDKEILQLHVEIAAVKTELKLYKEGAIHYAVATLGSTGPGSPPVAQS